MAMENAKAILEDPKKHRELAVRLDLYNPKKREFLRRIIDSGADQASQVRELGLLAFMANFETAMRSIREKITSLNCIFHRLKDCAPSARTVARSRLVNYVVTSDAGGNGSGAAIELMALLRRETRGMHVQIKCMIIGHDSFERELAGKPEQRDRTKANALCFHQEFDALNNDESVLRKFKFGPSERDAYQLECPLAGEIYIVGRRMPDGSDLESADAVMDSLALHQSAEGGTELNAFRSALEVTRPSLMAGRPKRST